MCLKGIVVYKKYCFNKFFHRFDETVISQD